MDVVRPAPTAWRPVGAPRDRPVDRWPWLWTTRRRHELSTMRPRVVHRCGAVHPRALKRLSTELSPDVGEVCAHGDVERPTGDRRTVSPAAGNRWTSPHVHEVKRSVTGSVTGTITGSGSGAVSVVDGTTSGRVSSEAEDRVLGASGNGGWWRPVDNSGSMPTTELSARTSTAQDRPVPRAGTRRHRSRSAVRVRSCRPAPGAGPRGRARSTLRARAAVRGGGSAVSAGRAA
ncbi:MAG: hypothetical protein QOK35_2671 [Pseudonocardiales bacterium]|jgi:hypothetical protein|nr:hypothetical protein [Pseudonocardiales bacterium]